MECIDRGLRAKTGLKLLYSHTPYTLYDQWFKNIVYIFFLINQLYHKFIKEIGWESLCNPSQKIMNSEFKFKHS